MSTPTHLISYLLHNHPHDVAVASDSDVLTLEQARLRLNSIHTFEWPSEITDVQVTPLLLNEPVSSSHHGQR